MPWHIWLAAFHPPLLLLSPPTLSPIVFSAGAVSSSPAADVYPEVLYPTFVTAVALSPLSRRFLDAHRRHILLSLTLPILFAADTISSSPLTPMIF